MQVLCAVVVGLVTYYSPGVMERVYASRLAWGHVAPCPECIGMAAVIDCGRLGEKVAIRGPLGYEGPFLVVDCGNAAHRAQQRKRGLIAEVDWPTAQRWGMRGGIEGAVADWVEDERYGRQEIIEAG